METLPPIGAEVEILGNCIKGTVSGYAIEQAVTRDYGISAALGPRTLVLVYLGYGRENTIEGGIYVSTVLCHPSNLDIVK